jgi:hypothetical protein
MEELSKAFRDTRAMAFTLGVGTVVMTHVHMLVFPGEPTPKSHALLNLVASGSILYGAGVWGG